MSARTIRHVRHAADEWKARRLRYNLNFPHVPFGTFSNDQVCIRYWRRCVFPG
jgi:hypothetical protein